MCFTAQGIFVHAPHFPGLSGANSRPIGRACAIARRRLDLAMLRAYTYSLNAKLDALLRLTSAHAAGAKLKQAIAGRSINNGSERALRPCLVFRKVTNRFRSECHLYPDTRSVLETTRRNAVRAFQAIRMALYPMPLPDTR